MSYNIPDGLISAIEENDIEKIRTILDPIYQSILS